MIRAGAAAATLVLLLAASPARAQEPTPPLNISADNVTGSHGPEGDIVLLNGHVRITRGRTVITAERGRYLRAQGMLFLDDDVRLVDSTTTLTCDHASYAEDTDMLQVNGRVVVRDRDAVLRAPRGIYDRRSGRLELLDGVQGVEGEKRIDADRAIYHRDTQVIQARGRVRGSDEASRIVLRADSVDYDRRSKEARATGNPVLESRDPKGELTELRAITLRLNTESRVAEAIDSVTIQRDTLRARADYALYDDRADRGWLLGSPRAWDDETTITGDTLEVWSRERELVRFVVRGNAVIDYQGRSPANVGEASRIVGERVDVHFTDEDIDSLVAVGRAVNDYTAVPRSGKTSESNRAEGDSITVVFRDRKVDRAVVRGSARGEYHFAVDTGDTAAARAQVVRYDADRIEFIVPRNRIVLDPNAHLVYKELELHAKRVEFDSEKQTLIASGDPELVDRGDKVVGHLMTYDLESQQGTIYQAETTYERGLYHGEQIRKVGDDILDVKQGSFSTCDMESPHYHFHSRWMKIYLKDKLVAKPVVFYVRNVPLLALPFYLFPIKPGRHSGFMFPQFELGFSNTAGQFIRNAGYYWAVNDYVDFTFSGDYYQADPSWVLRTEGVYKLLYVLGGRFMGTYARSELDDSDNWSFQADHSQDLTPRTHLTGAASYVSSREYQRSDQFGHPLSQQLERFLNSNLTVNHYAEWANFTGYIDRREDLDAERSIIDPDGLGPLQGPPPGTTASPSVTSSLPSLAIGFPTRAIGSIGWLKDTPLQKPLSSLYLSLGLQYLSYYTQHSFVQGYAHFDSDSVIDSTTTVIGVNELTRRGAQATVSLQDTRRLLGWINFQPFVSAQGVIFDFDNLGNEIVPAGVWSAGVATGTTIYGTALPRIGRLIGLRHVVSPSVRFSFSPSFEYLSYVDSNGVVRPRFTPFGGIGVSSSQTSFMSFGLEQRLQVKWGSGEEIRRLDNLLSWSITGSYDFLYREKGLTRGLSNLGSTLRLQPPGTFAADFSWTTDPYHPRPIRRFGSNMSLNLQGKAGPEAATPELPLEGGRRTRDLVDTTEPWSIGLSYSYSGAPVGDGWESTQSGNGVLRYNLTSAWGLEYSASLDITNKELTAQYFGITRDLHCWTASFTRSFDLSGQAEYYFRIGIKEQREVFVERGNRFGSVGGIQ